MVQEVHLLKEEFMRSRLPPKNTKDSQLHNAYSSKPIPIFIQSWVVGELGRASTKVVYHITFFLHFNWSQRQIHINMKHAKKGLTNASKSNMGPKSKLRGSRYEAVMGAKMVQEVRRR